MQSPRRFLRPAYIFIAFVILAGIIFVIAELDQIVLAIQKADWRAIPGALFFTVISYVSMSISFAMVCRLFIRRASLRALAEIGYVTNVLNHIVTSGGVAGISLRLILMGKHGVPARDTIASTMMHFYIASIDMMIMLPVGLIYLLQNARVAPGIAILLQITTLVLILLTIIATFIIFNNVWRRSVLKVTSNLVKKLTRRDMRSTFSQFDKSMKRGIILMRRRPGWVTVAVILTIVDWFASVMVLSYCLDAFGPHQPFGTVMTGYVIGISIGLLSMIPGGIGVQESSMTFVFYLLGVPIGQAILASILFRAIFFILPYLVSLLLYRPLLQSDQPSTST